MTPDAAALLPGLVDDPPWRILLDAGLQAHVEQEHDRAETRYRAALDEAERAEAGPQDLVKILENLFVLYTTFDQPTKAVVLGRRLLRLLRQLDGPRATSVGEMCVRQAAAMCAAGADVERAVPLFQRGLRILQARLGRHAPAIGLSLKTMAHALLGREHIDLALPLYLSALHILEAAGAEYQPSVALILTALGQSAQTFKRPRLAERYLRRALDICAAVHGPNSEPLAETAQMLAELYEDEGELARAEPLLRRALLIFEDGLGPNDPGVAYCLQNIARVCLGLNQPEQALVYYRRAVAIYESTKTAADANWRSFSSSLRTSSRPPAGRTRLGKCSGGSSRRRRVKVGTNHESNRSPRCERLRGWGQKHDGRGSVQATPPGIPGTPTSPCQAPNGP